MQIFQTHQVTETDNADWQILFNCYANFYRVSMNDEIADRVWTWLLNPDHVLEGFLARSLEGFAVGMAHVRSCPRPLGGCDIGFLDDLYVLPDSRGQGVAGASLQALKNHAHSKGWPAIRWLTQSFNTRGRKFYDRYTDGCCSAPKFNPLSALNIDPYVLWRRISFLFKTPSGWWFKRF